MKQLLSILNLQTDSHHVSTPVYVPQIISGANFGERFGRPEQIRIGKDFGKHLRLSAEDKGSSAQDYFQPYTVNVTLEIEEPENRLEDEHI